MLSSDTISSIRSCSMSHFSSTIINSSVSPLVILGFKESILSGLSEIKERLELLFNFPLLRPFSLFSFLSLYLLALWQYYSDHRGFSSVSVRSVRTLPEELRCRNCSSKPITLSLLSPVSSHEAAMSLGLDERKGNNGKEEGERGGVKS